MPDFRMGHCQLSTRAIEFPFRERAASPARSRARPFASRLGATQPTVGVALIGMYCVNICLEFETFFGSSDAYPDALASRVGAGMIIPLPRVLQVGDCLE